MWMGTPFWISLSVKARSFSAIPGPRWWRRWPGRPPQVRYSPGSTLPNWSWRRPSSDKFPCAGLVRFSLSGSEAVHAALRAARVHTGRNRFLKFEGHYHGWFDNVAVSVSAPSADALGSRLRPRLRPWTQGRPPSSDAEVITASWNDLEAVERALAFDSDGVAAVIAEPVMCNSGCILPEKGFLEGLRSLCSFYGAVLIFDEVITGVPAGNGRSSGLLRSGSRPGHLRQGDGQRGFRSAPWWERRR